MEEQENLWGDKYCVFMEGKEEMLELDAEDYPWMCIYSDKILIVVTDTWIDDIVCKKCEQSHKEITRQQIGVDLNDLFDEVINHWEDNALRDLPDYISEAKDYLRNIKLIQNKLEKRINEMKSIIEKK